MPIKRRMESVVGVLVSNRSVIENKSTVIDLLLLTYLWRNLINHVAFVLHSTHAFTTSLNRNMKRICKNSCRGRSKGRAAVSPHTNIFISLIRENNINYTQIRHNIAKLSTK